LVRALGYRVVGEPAPTDTACVLIGAPHTSWLDFPLMLGIAWSEDLVPKWLGKKELFHAPFGAVMRRLGGIPVDRDNPGSLVADMAARAAGAIASRSWSHPRARGERHVVGSPASTGSPRTLAYPSC
jgi:1-acyl-sn-glycerol-3-phosphate acyltransferase